MRTSAHPIKTSEYAAYYIDKTRALKNPLVELSLVLCFLYDGVDQALRSPQHRMDLEIYCQIEATNASWPVTIAPV
jgi:hypothetical protein